MLSQIRWALGAAVMAAFAYLGVRNRQLSSDRDDAMSRAEQAEGYTDTRKRMDDADESLGDDPAVARDWLRERGKR